MGNKITQETLYEAIEASRYKEAQEIIKVTSNCPLNYSKIFIYEYYLPIRQIPYGSTNK